MTAPTSTRAGAQVVERVARILRVLAAHPAGVATSDVAARADLTRPTAHRILTALADESIARFDREARRWHLGEELAVLGAMAGARLPRGDDVRSALHRVAATTGETALYAVHRGRVMAFVFSDEGDNPAVSDALSVGRSWPLAATSAGIALVAARDEEPAPRSFDDDAVQALESARRDGWARSVDRLRPGHTDIAVALCDSDGAPQAALVVALPTARDSREHRAEVVAALTAEAARLSVATRSDR